MQGKITSNFYHLGRWYFPGDLVEGAVASAAHKKGCLQEQKETKSAGAAPENKGSSE